MRNIESSGPCYLEKVLRYQIVSEEDTGSLIRWINDFMKAGWKPLGSPFVVGRKICQAMIKEGLST
jgi:hypothetical protein